MMKCEPRVIHMVKCEPRVFHMVKYKPRVIRVAQVKWRLADNTHVSCTWVMMFSQAVALDYHLEYEYI